MASAAGSVRRVDAWQRFEEKGVEVGAVQEIVTTGGTTDGMIYRNAELDVKEKTDFERNGGMAAREIARSIAVDVQERWKAMMSTRYMIKPILGNPSREKYPLAFTHNVKQIKRWMGEAAKEEPFCSWFEGLGQLAPKKETDDSKTSFIQGSALPGEVDKTIFQKYMAILGPQVKTETAQRLKEYQGTPGNSKFQFTVTWVDSTLAYIPADAQYVEVAAWVSETPLSPQPDAPPVSQYPAPQCTIS